MDTLYRKIKDRKGAGGKTLADSSIEVLDTELTALLRKFVFSGARAPRVPSEDGESRFLTLSEAEKTKLVLSLVAVKEVLRLPVTAEQRTVVGTAGISRRSPRTRISTGLVSAETASRGARFFDGMGPVVRGALMTTCTTFCQLFDGMGPVVRGALMTTCTTFCQFFDNMDPVVRGSLMTTCTTFRPFFEDMGPVMRGFLITDPIRFCQMVCGVLL